MNDNNRHPWQSGPKELFEFALNTLKTHNEINQRISFLLFDLGIETLFKTFLSLPEEITNTKLSFADRKKYANGNFHDLIKGIRLAANVNISESDLHNVKFYHDIRNHLYHQGDGITVRQDHVNGYAKVGTTLLKQLLGIDLISLIETSFNQEVAINTETLIKLRNELSEEINRYRELVKLFTENIEPKLIYPSTVAKLKEIALNVDVSSFGSKVEDFRKLLERNIHDKDMRSWLLEFIADDIRWDSPQVLSNTQYIMELGKDPISFYSFIIGLFFLPIGEVRNDSLDNSEDITFIDSDEYHILGVYSASCFFVEFFLNKTKYEKEDALALKRSQELLSKLELVIKRLESITSA